MFKTSNSIINEPKCIHPNIYPEVQVEGVDHGGVICFSDQYSTHCGIITFRGDYHRSGANYGFANGTILEQIWSIDIGKMKKTISDGFWTGCGWTGQPLIVRWSDEIRPCLKRNKNVTLKPFTEAIYATMDGNIYFIDIETGIQTREPVFLGLPFKGSGSLDPRQIPIGYFGAGENGQKFDAFSDSIKPGGDARCVAVNLATGEVIYEFGNQDQFALREFHGYDSAVLVHAQTDTLIAPGENGILYKIRLNTEFDQQFVKITFTPDSITKLRYTTDRNTAERYWLGMEDSGVFYNEFYYIADNGGNLLCININTMKIVWTLDCWDDTNASPVLEVEDGIPYIYIGTSLHWGASAVTKIGDVAMFKVNALTGQYCWIKRFLCATLPGISGGIQATALLGKGNISDLLIFPVARTPCVQSGILVAVNKKTGETVWQNDMTRYSWSSPVAIYDESGNGQIMIPQLDGTLQMLDGRTGRLIHQIQLGGYVEASPAIFNDILVIGTRSQKIIGVQIR